MTLTSSIVVERPIEDAWRFLSDPGNAPRWDRSIARATVLSGAYGVGAVVETQAPSGMVQRFVVDELSAPRRLAFTLLESAHFSRAQLVFELTAHGAGTRIEHVITVSLRWRWLLLLPVLLLTQRRALAEDLESLRQVLNGTAART